jgi:hypothetical protein
VHEVAARAYFAACLAAGRLLRSATYSTVQVAEQEGELRVRKQRSPCAPLLVRLAGPLSRLLDTGVRVLPQGEWAARERGVYRSLRDTPVRIERNGILVLPRLAGRTLATMLEDADLAEPTRTQAVRVAVAALADFHRLGFTHADAMADNVMVDLDAGRAHWFDFETVHEPHRAVVWRRADDVRALLVTCLLRTAPAKRAEVLRLVLDVYGDEDVTRTLAASFASVWQRPLAFHLAQAALSLQEFRTISELLATRLPAHRFLL